MTIANHVNKKIVIATQSEKGTIAAVDAASAQRLRYQKFNQDQTNETYMSNEIRVDRQVGDVNIGPQDGNGACNGELTPETYELFEAAVLRKVFATAIDGVAAVGKITSDATSPADGDTVTIDTKIYTFKTALTPTEGEVLIGASAAVALDNLLSAINHTGTPDTDYKCAAVHPTVTATTNADTTQLVAAKTKGVAGNSIALAATSDHLAVDAAVLGTEVAGVDGTGSDPANVGVAAAATSGAAGTFTRDDANGSWIADGFKLGDVVQQTGWTTDGVTNNTHNFLITALTATVMTVLAIDGTPPAAKVKGDSVVTAVKGQKCWIPATGHTEDWFTIEHNYSDVDLSEIFWDCKLTSMAIKAPATGIPTVDFNILGLQMTAKDNALAPYFTGPTAITATEVVHSGKAVVLVSGVEQTLATGIDFEIVGNNQAMAPVIGTNVKPGISDGRVEIKGNLSILFEDDTIAGYYRAGTEVSIFIVLPVSDAADAAFVAFTIHVAKLTGTAKDGDNGIVQSIPFTAKFNSAGSVTVNTLATSLSMQDSTLS